MIVYIKRHFFLWVWVSIQSIEISCHKTQECVGIKRWSISEEISACAFVTVFSFFPWLPTHLLQSTHKFIPLCCIEEASSGIELTTLVMIRCRLFYFATPFFSRYFRKQNISHARTKVVWYYR